MAQGLISFQHKITIPCTASHPDASRLRRLVPLSVSPGYLPKDSQDLVTVIIPARNEENSIEECLQSVLSQDWLNLQVVVVDGGSDDRTAEVVLAIAAADPRVELVRNPHRVIPISLNLGLSVSRSKWIVRVDAHASVAPDYVRLAVSHLETGVYGAVGGRKNGVGKTPAGRAVAQVMSSRFGVGGSTYHWGEKICSVEHVPFGAYPTSLLRQLGGWDETLEVNQDFELDFRVRQAGRDILFDPSLRIDWACRQSVRALFKQYRRYGSGKLVVAKKHPASLRPRHLAAPLLVLDLVAAGIVLTCSRRLAAGMVGPYVLALALATGANLRYLDRNARIYVAPAFVAMHIGWGVGFWERLLKEILKAYFDAKSRVARTAQQTSA